MTDEPDVNENAYRIVEEATFGSPPCDKCGSRMQRREKPSYQESFGGETVRHTKVYFACPRCGHVIDV
jgi:predicted RNA-binding Zn-ribbon protein involved in translation (DUF1610 family)